MFFLYNYGSISRLIFFLNGLANQLFPFCLVLGYGYLAPATKCGKIACIFYALFGIPMFLNALGQLSMLTKRRIHKIELYLQIIFRSQKIYKHAVLIIIVACFYITAFVLPSVFIAQMENWSLSDSFYYSFITLSTIGTSVFRVTR